MNEQEAYTSINKGIPNYVMLELSIKTLINECASDKDQLTNELKVLRELYRDKVIFEAGYTKANEYFFDTLRIVTSYKTAESRLCISPIPFITKLKNILGVDNPSTDFNDQVLYQELLSRVKVLGNIVSPEELKANFPAIYADYELSTKSYAQIKTYERNHPIPRSTEVKDKIDRQYRLYRNFALDSDFCSFIVKQARMYRNLVVKRQFIEGYANRTQLNPAMFSGLDKEKFELYLADRYLETAIASDDKDEKQRCIYYIATYIRETKVSKVTIKNDSGQKVSFNQLVRRYKKFLQSNTNIRPLDEPRENFRNYHINHVQNHVNKYFFTNVNWQIVPPGKEEDLDKAVISSLNRKYNYLSPSEREKRILERYGIYERKIRFYESSGYVQKVYGRNTFTGYIAYIYPNGEILMDKFFDDSANCIPTIGEAIYNVQVPDFDRLSRLSKTTLIKEAGCTRIIHSGKWEDKGRAIIARPPIPDAEQQVKKLIKEIKESKAE